MQARYVIVAAIVVVAGYFMIWSDRAGKLEFNPLASPQGFRELVLTNRSTTRDPVSAILSTSGAAQTDVLKGEGPSVCDALFRDPASPVLENRDSELNIAEFFDYRCPYCKTLAKIMVQVQASEPRVRVIYKEWPILTASSELAARAALAAAKQGKYLQFHSRLMSSRFITTDGYIRDLAAGLNIDYAQLRQDMASDETSAALQRTAALAGKLGFVGTPSLVVGRTIVQGAITQAQLERLVALEIERPHSAGC